MISFPYRNVWSKSVYFLFQIPRRILKEVAEKTLKDYVGKDDNYEL